MAEICRVSSILPFLLYHHMDSVSVSTSYTFARSLLAGITLLAYNTIISFEDEREYIWLRKFTIATLFYCFAQYATLISLILGLMPVFVQDLSACNTTTYVGYAFEILGYIGIQGLLIARAHALTRYHALTWYRWFVSVLLGALFCGAVTLAIIPTFLAPGCILQAGLIVRCVSIRPSMNVIISVDYSDLTLAQNILTLAMETIASIVVFCGTFDSWRGHRERKRHTPIAQILLTQGVLRYLFVTITSVINLVLVAKNITSTVIDFWNTLQGTLSAIVICQFTLELRRRCSSRAIETDLLTNSRSMRTIPEFIESIHFALRNEFGEPVEDERIGTLYRAGSGLFEIKEIKPTLQMT